MGHVTITIREDPRDVPPSWKARDPLPDELPRAAKALLALAGQTGAEVRATHSRGYTIDGQGRVVMTTRREPQTEDDGTPILTPTGRSVVKVVPTGEPKVVVSIAIRLRRVDGGRAVVCWLDNSVDYCAILQGSDIRRATLPEVRQWLED